MAGVTFATDGAELAAGPVTNARQREPGPAIWLAGDPADLKTWLPRGGYGIVTNTVVLNEMVQKYGPLTEVIKRYLDITDKPVVVEVDGQTTAELLDVAHMFTKMSDQIIIKVPCAVHGLEVFGALAREGVETFCTTTFSLPQAATVAQAGATHILPFCEPVKQVGGDPTKLVRECVAMFSGWQQRPHVTAALIRSADVAHLALRDGADGIIIFWSVLEEMMQHPLTDEWNQTFADQWMQMHAAGYLEDIPVKPAH
jgi:transaldolase